MPSSGSRKGESKPYPFNGVLLHDHLLILTGIRGRVSVELSSFLIAILHSLQTSRLQCGGLQCLCALKLFVTSNDGFRGLEPKAEVWRALLTLRVYACYDYSVVYVLPHLIYGSYCKTNQYLSWPWTLRFMAVSNPVNILTFNVRRPVITGLTPLPNSAVSWYAYNVPCSKLFLWQSLALYVSTFTRFRILRPFLICCLLVSICMMVTVQSFRVDNLTHLWSLYKASELIT